MEETLVGIKKKTLFKSTDGQLNSTEITWKEHIFIVNRKFTIQEAVTYLSAV